MLEGRRQVCAALIVVVAALGCKDRAKLDESSARARAAALEHLRTSAAATDDVGSASDDARAREPSPIDPVTDGDVAPTAPLLGEREPTAEVVATRAERPPVVEPVPVVTRTETYVPDEKDGEFDRPPPSISLYTATWCGPCKATKRWFDERKISYQEFDVDQSDNNKKIARALADAGKKYSGIPVLDWNDTFVTGYRPNDFQQLATASGWAPKTKTRTVGEDGRPVADAMRSRTTRPVEVAPARDTADDGQVTKIYTYTDKDGVTHVVDNPNRIPKRYR